MGDRADTLTASAKGDQAGNARRRKRHSKRKEKARKREKLVRNIAWLGGGLAVGLPLLAAMLYAMSQ